MRAPVRRLGANVLANRLTNPLGDRATPARLRVFEVPSDALVEWGVAGEAVMAMPFGVHRAAPLHSGRRSNTR